MSVSFLAAGAGAAVAAVITGILVWRFARLPRLDQAAWMCAGLGLTVALAAQALGYHRGFNPVTFRAVQVGARLVAPMALVWGLAELTAKSFVVRFGARLGVAALTVIAGVILVADPLNGTAFTTAWPASDAHYQFIPHVVLLALAAATALPAVIALIVAAVRARREPGWREVFLPVASAAVAVLLTEGLQVKLPVKSGYAAICVAAAALTWLAGERSRRLQLPALHDGAAAGDDTGWDEPYTDGAGFGRYQPATGGFGRVGSDTDFGGLYRSGTGGSGPDTGESQPVSGDTDFAGLYRPDTGELYHPDTGEFEAVGSDTGYGFYRTDTDLGPVVSGGQDLPRNEPLPGIIETGDILPVAFDVFAPAASGPDNREDETARLYGQIAIYTLIEGQAEEFDRLAQDVVEKVKALEPDTLAYIVHGVPSAPLQRILYEVYRDEAAFAEHGHQPYIQEFEEQRKPYILATNVIELGVQQAKLSPLGSQPGMPGQPVPPGQPSQRGRPAPQGQPAAPARPSTPDPQRRPAQPDPQRRPGPPGPADPQRRPSQQDRPAAPGPERRPNSRGPLDPHRRPSQQGQPSPQDRSGQQGRPGSQDRSGPLDQPRPQGRPGPQDQPGARGGSGSQGRPGPQDRPGPQGPPGPQGQPDQHVRSGLYGRPRPQPQPGPQDRPDPPGQRGPWVPPDDEPAERRSNGAR